MMLRILILFVLFFANIASANEQLNVTTYSLTNHPKAGKLDASVDYPSTWVASEGQHEHIVQMFYDNTQPLLKRHCGVAVGFAFSNLSPQQIKEIIDSNSFNFEDNTIMFRKGHMHVKKFEYVDGKIVCTGKKFEETDLKSKSSQRILGIPKELTEILKKYKESQKEVAKANGIKFTEDDYAFTSDTYRPYDSNDIYDRMKNLLKRIRITDWKELSPHCLRHTYCSTGIRNKVPIADMQKLLGHENISVTAEWYTHFDKEQIIKSSNEVNKNRISKLKRIENY